VGEVVVVQVDPLVERLRDERQALGLSQRTVASDVNIGHGHLSQIETGRVDPKLSTVRRLADRLGVPL
jgi:transcriptional regulator with XRE-family HTH domain